MKSMYFGYVAVLLLSGCVGLEKRVRYEAAEAAAQYLESHKPMLLNVCNDMDTHYNEMIKGLKDSINQK